MTKHTEQEEKEQEEATPLKRTIPQAQWLCYRIGRGEQGVLTFEPYKSALLPHWRFRTAALARRSAAVLWSRFEAFDAQDDFVGMDMARKFLQMGMTRAKRYANHAGGRKYRKGTREELPRRGDDDDGSDAGGRREKEEASAVFREVWVRCKAHEGYGRRKEAFLKMQRDWEKGEKGERRAAEV
ncbi:hypothetical protein F4778DRAFT_549461 [Xylariomycetidae sp. FL2044]|nr:hypothetical protein F4778DRAFT_548792 [Xylariomycetidae sp. FL2044]KAH9907625.1 hypothetical protein F4778DRAFT_549461 [Xylariomycetidae sp. FL2044]